MSLRRGPSATAAIVLILAACSAAPGSSPALQPSAGGATPSSTAATATTPAAATTPAGASPSDSASGSPSGSGGATGSAGAAPEFGEAPLWVRNRQPLPFCGTEEQRTETFDVATRQCFVAAAAAGQPAEMLIRLTTIEGGLVQYLFRTTPGNPFEQIIDGTGDAYGSGRWERQVCVRMTRGDPVREDPTGALNFGFDSCEDATPPL